MASRRRTWPIRQLKSCSLLACSYSTSPLESDLVPYLMACATGRLAEMPAPVWRDEAAICVVLAAKGYPDKPAAGGEIRGAGADFGPDVAVFHAGTKLDDAGALRAAGGRVLNVCARAPTLREARDDRQCVHFSRAQGEEIASHGAA